MTAHAIRLTALVVLASLFVAGCGESGPPKTIVKGRLTNKGEPMPVKPMVGKLRLWLLPQDTTPADPKEAVIEPDGNFEVKGLGTGIPAGKYKVCVTWQDDFPMGPDKLGKKFDAEHSKIYRTVPDDGDIVIDVARPQG